jgi:hypothetical protein
MQAGWALCGPAALLLMLMLMMLLAGCLLKEVAGAAVIVVGVGLAGRGGASRAAAAAVPAAAVVAAAPAAAASAAACPWPLACLPSCPAGLAAVRLQQHAWLVGQQAVTACLMSTHQQGLHHAMHTLGQGCSIEARQVSAASQGATLHRHHHCTALHSALQHPNAHLQSWPCLTRCQKPYASSCSWRH